MSGVDPNWIMAGVAASGAALGAHRWYVKSTNARRTRQSEYLRLWHTNFGWPAQHDSDGVEYEPARPGTVQRLADLEARYGSHTEHPPRTDSRVTAH